MDGGGGGSGGDELLDMALDSSVAAPSRAPSRFAPKVKGKAVVKAEPGGGLLRVKKPPEMKQEPENDFPAAKKVEPAAMDSEDMDVDWGNTDAMEVDSAEDVVIREFDVLLNPSLGGGAQLYVMQFPLRPSWRPYEINERCNEVRGNSNLSKIEVDLGLDANNKNFDREVAEHLELTKQTLCSSEVPLATHYAIGILIGDKSLKFSEQSFMRSGAAELEVF